MPDEAPTGPDNVADMAHELLRDMPCGIAVTDAEGGILFLNSTLSRWLGQPPETVSSGLQLADLMTVPGRIYLETVLMPMLLLQGYVREISCRLQRKDGTTLPVLLNAVLRKDARDRPARIDLTLFDATERSRYEGQLRAARHEAEALAAIVRTSPNAILRADAKGVILAWNASAERLLGHSEKAALGAAIDALVPLADRPDWFADSIAACKGRNETTFETVLKNGREFEITLAPIRSRSTPGMTPDYSVILRDIDARKKAEQHLRLMVREMDHRVKNTLAVVNGIARQTLPTDQHSSFTKRLRALSRAHDVLTEAHWDNIDMALLMQITREEAGGASKFSYAGPPVSLEPRQVTALSMALHELTTNALKYGALSNDGTIEVQYGFENNPDRHLFIEWREIGGPRVRPPPRQGFGRRMIETILRAEFSADVQFDFAPDGLFCRILFPFEAGTGLSDEAG